MKKMIRNTSVLALLSILLVSCYRQDDIYKEFVQVGGYNYPAMSQNLAAKTGYGWATLSWDQPIDPMVKSAKVFWDNYSKSLDVDYADFSDGKVVVTIDDLEGRSYTFDVINYDGKGNRSLAAEITVSPDGENWLVSHSERTVVKAVADGDDAVVTMSKSTDEMVKTVFRYVTNSGETVDLDTVLEPGENVIRLPGAKKNKRFQFRSAYCRPEGKDTVWAVSWTTSPGGISFPLDTRDWTVTVTEGQVRGDRFAVSNIFDGVIDGSHNWYSAISTALRKVFPKIIAIDTHREAGQEYSFTFFEFYESTNSESQRYIKSHIIYIGNQPYDPDSENYQAEFGAYAEKSSFEKTEPVQTCAINPSRSGRYLAVVFLDSHSNNGYIDLWELIPYGFFDED